MENEREEEKQRYQFNYKIPKIRKEINDDQEEEGEQEQRKGLMAMAERMKKEEEEETGNGTPTNILRQILNKMEANKMSEGTTITTPREGEESEEERQRREEVEEEQEEERRRSKEEERHEERRRASRSRSPTGRGSRLGKPHKRTEESRIRRGDELGLSENIRPLLPTNFPIPVPSRPKPDNKARNVYAPGGHPSPSEPGPDLKFIICLRCSERFSSPSSFSRHLAVAHYAHLLSPEGTPFQRCPIVGCCCCEVEMEDRRTYVEHLAAEHDVMESYLGTVVENDLGWEV